MTNSLSRSQCIEIYVWLRGSSSMRISFVLKFDSTVCVLDLN